jgi:hypothetical protein
MANSSEFGVDAQYRHYPKVFTPKPELALGAARLKWYQLAKEATPVEPATDRLARDYLEAEFKAGRLALDGELGFVVLHRCGTDFYFLLVSTWRNSNELWESVLYKDGGRMRTFDRFEFQGHHRGTFCVWELGAVWHEQQAWSRYLSSARDEAARATYLADLHSGIV